MFNASAAFLVHHRMMFVLDETFHQFTSNSLILIIFVFIVSIIIIIVIIIFSKNMLQFQR